MGIICQMQSLPLWDCHRPAIGIIEVCWDNDWSGQRDERIDYPFCSFHKEKAQRMATRLAEFFHDGNNREVISNVRITSVIEGEAREVEYTQLPNPLVSKEF